ncbi:MAG: alpha/beta fold hydrolase [Planctomycetaceae bacterium]
MDGIFQSEPAWRTKIFTAAVGRALERAAAVALLAASVAAAACAAPPCPAADVWVASTRRLPGICRMPERADLCVERLAGGDSGRWVQAGIDELVAEPGPPLVIFIHGNRYTPADARSQGVRLARLCAAACPDGGPVRTVVFSWPSEQQGVLLRDARAKYDRAHADGHYLAWLLAQLGPERPVSLVGYSYGAIVGLEALDDLVTDGDAAVPWACRPGRTHLVFVVPAVRCDALAPRGPYRDAVAGVDRFTLVANSADCALTFFNRVDRCVGAEALGATGMSGRRLPAGLEYCGIDAADVIGHGHLLPLYLDTPCLARRIAAGAAAGLDAPPGE